MVTKKVPILLLSRICSRALSRNISTHEIKAWNRILKPHIQQNRGSIFQFSTSSFKQNDGQNQKENEESQKPPNFNPFLITTILLGGYLFLTRNQQNPNEESRTKVTWNDFYYGMLQAGEVENVTILPSSRVAVVKLKDKAIFKGQQVSNGKFIMEYSEDLDPEMKIRDFEKALGIPPGLGIPVKYDRRGETFSTILTIVIFLGLTAAIANFMRKSIKVSGGMSGMNPLSGMSKANFTLVTPQIKLNKGTKFADVAGLREAKIEVKEFVDYLKNPEKYKELGAKPPKGAILFGPPGCGKTMLAKAVANESNVPFLSMNGSEFIEMIGGLGASRVRSLFKEARSRAPAIIYIDEIDAIGKKRSESNNPMSGGSSEQEQTLNQLLVEMDGIESANSNVILLASTNRADVLDKALLRPGRFDRQITIDLPTVIERKEILEQHMKGVQLAETSNVFSERLATLTPGFSGADLANLVNEAALHAARVKHTKVQKDDLEYAIERVIAGTEKKTNVLGPNERKIVAYHESGHAIVGWMLQHTDALLKVTIIPRTSQALGFAQYTPQDKKLFSPEELMDRMCMALGGRVAESLTFNRVTTGAQNDLEKVTKMAYSQIKNFGFNENVGLVSYEEGQFGQKPYSKRLQATMDQEARQMIAAAYKRTEEILKTHQNALEKMAQALLEKETLNYDDVEKLIGPPPHGKKHLVSPVEYEHGLKRESEIGSKEAEGV